MSFFIPGNISCFEVCLDITTLAAVVVSMITLSVSWALNTSMLFCVYGGSWFARDEL